MTRPDSFFRMVPIVLELYRRKWQLGNMYPTTQLPDRFWNGPMLRKAILKVSFLHHLKFGLVFKWHLNT